jgi:hypothetical protein
MKKTIAVLTFAVALIAGIATVSTLVNQQVESVQLADPGRGA